MSVTDWQREDFLRAARGRRPRRSALTLLLLVLLTGLGGGVFWASRAVIEEVARAEGRVVPSGRARIVESLEGGVVREIAVAEGDAVTRGDVLVRIDDTGAAASLGEYEARRQALVARAARLAAEAEGAERLSLDAIGVDPEGPLALREAALFDSRRASFLSQSAVLQAQIDQRAQEIATAQAGIARVEENLALLDEEIAINTESGIVPRAQIIPLERERTARRQERDDLTGRVGQARAALIEAQARLEELRLARRAEVNAERSDVLNELAVIEESIKRAVEVVSRAALRAPVDGIVSSLSVNTLDEVIAPGEEVLRIVPSGAGLQVEARARPEDIAFLRPDLPAKIDITAFDFTVYGSLEGRVVRVGADAETDEATGQVYFPVILETDRTVLERGAERHEIRPGMVASVGVLTGERTVLDYLLKPLRRAEAQALRER